MPLSVLIWLPAAAGVLGALALAIGYVVSFDRGSSGLQFVTDQLWIPQLGIHYKLGLDGLNLFLILLTALLFAAGMLAAHLREWERSRLFYFQLALAESG